MTELESHEVVELHFNQNSGTNSNYEYIHVEEMQCDSENTYVIMVYTKARYTNTLIYHTCYKRIMQLQ